MVNSVGSTQTQMKSCYLSPFGRRLSETDSRPSSDLERSSRYAVRELWLIASCDIVNKSLPANIARPPVILPGGIGIRPIIARLVTLLPDPDSPTIPTVSPFSMLNDTPRTASTTPSSVWKPHTKIIYRKQRLGHYRFFILGSNASRNPSPKKFSANSVNANAPPGNITSHHCDFNGVSA